MTAKATAKKIQQAPIGPVPEAPPAPAPPPAAPAAKAPKLTLQKNILISGNYFQLNPDNILAETSSAKSRYGKSVTVYKGNISNVDRIEVPESFKQASKKEDATTSVFETTVVSSTLKDSEIVDNLLKAINQSPKDQNKKKTRLDQIKATGIETYSIKEVFNLPDLNPDIDVEDIKIFLWYQLSMGRPVNSMEWYSLGETDPKEVASWLLEKEYIVGKENLPAKIVDWIENSKLFYFDGKWFPEFMYLSGNVYDKYQALTVSESFSNQGSDAKLIIEHFGEKVLANQIKKLASVFEQKYAERLRITDDDKNTGLRIKPISKFAKEYKIKEYADGQNFKWKIVSASKHKRYGQPDWTAEKYEANHDFSELSLTDAFCLWLITDPNIKFSGGISYMDIINFYILGKNRPKLEYGEIKAEQVALFERKKSRSKNLAEKLFITFLDSQITLNDKVSIEVIWNKQFNNNVPIKFSKIPVAFRMNKFIFGQPLDVRPEKREAVAFTLASGSGLLAYDVGVGKTPAAIFTICQYIDMGYCERPIVCVPNQTYKQWISEFKNFAGHLPINPLYNLSDDIVERWISSNGTLEIPAGSVTIITHEGLKKIGFNESTESAIYSDISTILAQDTSDMTDKAAQKDAIRTNTKIEELLGKALSRTKVTIEEFGFDYLCLDEAHAAKKVFTNVQGEAEENTGSSNQKGRIRKEYKIQSGDPSGMGIKTFVICQYLQKKYHGNTQLLTATPFTNSPLEVYSVLSMVAHDSLKKMGLDNLTTFFDTFVEVSYELIINAKLKPERRQIILGFTNLIVLQSLVRRYVNHKTGEQVGVKRPNKYVLPLTHEMVDNVLMPLEKSQQVNSAIDLSSIQAELMEKVKAYASGELSESSLCDIPYLETDNGDEEDTATDPEAQEIDEKYLDTDESAGVLMLKAMNYGRNLALSPYLFDCSGLAKPNALQYVNSSNKLLYVMGCIKSIKEHHEKTNTTMSGVVIYLDRGVAYFPLIRQYIAENLGFSLNEIGIISSKVKVPTPPKMPAADKKEYVKNLFNGQKYNEASGEVENVPDSERIKILIGSSTIREGINLQKYSATLFNCFLSWLPTDIQQLTGRIYRQGNAFANVRIVNPLMIDSMDIFMFQKLEEKTSRINSIWQSDGKTNVLKTEEFDPAALKYALIKSPDILANLEIIEIKETLDEKVSDLENDLKRIDKIRHYKHTITTYSQKLRDWLLEYRPKSKDKPLDDIIKASQLVLRNQTDAKGLPMELPYLRTDPETIYSTLTPAKRQHYQDDIISANRNLKRVTTDYLVPNGFTVDTEFSILEEDIKNKIQILQESKKKLNSPDALNVRRQEVIKKQELLQENATTVHSAVQAFGRLNYLLDDVKTRKIASPAPKPKLTKQDYLDSITGAELLEKYSTDKKEKQHLSEYIEGLKIIVEYL